MSYRSGATLLSSLASGLNHAGAVGCSGSGRPRYALGDSCTPLLLSHPSTNLLYQPVPSAFPGLATVHFEMKHLSFGLAPGLLVENMAGFPTTSAGFF